MWLEPGDWTRVDMALTLEDRGNLVWCEILHIEPSYCELPEGLDLPDNFVPIDGFSMWLVDWKTRNVVEYFLSPLATVNHWRVANAGPPQV